jgi:hypothetical protein
MQIPELLRQTLLQQHHTPVDYPQNPENPEVESLGRLIDLLGAEHNFFSDNDKELVYLINNYSPADLLFYINQYLSE